MRANGKRFANSRPWLKRVRCPIVDGQIGNRTVNENAVGVDALMILIESRIVCLMKLWCK